MSRRPGVEGGPVTGLSSLGAGRVPFAASSTALSTTDRLWRDPARGFLQVALAGVAINPVECADAALVAQGGSGNVNVVCRTNNREQRFGVTTTAAQFGSVTTNSWNGWYANSDNVFRIDAAASGETALWLRRNLSGAYSLQRVSVGVADSAGTGYRAILVPN